jgi:hypothetical protein
MATIREGTVVAVDVEAPFLWFSAACLRWVVCEAAEADASVVWVADDVTADELEPSACPLDVVCLLPA